MKAKKSKLIAGAVSAVLCLGTSAQMLSSTAVEETEPTVSKLTMSTNLVETTDGITISSENISTENNKNENINNPISSDFFCADPTSVEYNGRLYLIGTNDHEQFLADGPEVDNKYDKIKSMVILSTDDMVNWIYHGEINIGEVAPWIINSWAPTIVSRVEDDGKTHFYLYFSNNGLGVGVIHATDPLGPWDDPLGEPLISTSTPGLTNCPNPFDPGAVIDDNGVGWLSFGAGIAADGSEYMPGSNRIVRLGDDMISFDSEFAEIPAPYHFEASELNYINDTYVYTYNCDWSDHTEQWDYDCEAPSGCSMVYMTSKTPLDPESWEMKGEYFANPGPAGMGYSNNHTHLHKYQGEYYIFYHTLMLKTGMGITGAYRSLGVDKINVDEETVTIEKKLGTKEGTDSIICVDPYSVNAAAELNNTAEVTYDTTDNITPIISSSNVGSWFSVKDVQFTESLTPDEPVAAPELSLTAVDTIEYDITVTSVDKPTTVSMYPATSAGVDCIGSVDITEPGRYKITCDMGGAEQLMNMGYFKASDDALITFIVDSMTINDEYEFYLSNELTNTREWADGLKNVWGGYSDGDKLYTSDFAEFRFNGTDGAIEFYSAPISNGGTSNAPLVDTPLTFMAEAKGSGRIEVRLDSSDGDVLTSVDFDSPDEFKTIYNTEVGEIGGTHDLYFVFSEGDISIRSWTFTSETIPPTDTTTVPTTEPSTTPTDSDIVWGDADCNGEVELNDAVLVMSNAIDSENNPITTQGAENADVYQNGDGLSNMDALAIQKYLAQLISELPESYMS